MSLPNELLAVILTHLAEGYPPSLDALRSCSYASSSLRFIAQKHLFASVTIELFKLPMPDFGICDIPSKSHSLRFLHLLDDAPHIGPLVKTMRIAVVRPADREIRVTDVLDEVEDWIEAQGLYSAETNPDVAIKPALAISAILPRLNNLNELHFSSFRSVAWEWESLHVGAQNAIIDACRTRVAILSTYQVPSFPLGTICDTQTLQHLILDPPFESPQGSTSTSAFPNPRKLDALTITLSLDNSWTRRGTSRGSSAAYFKNPSCPVSLSNLRRLVLKDRRILDFRLCFSLCSATLEELEFRTVHEHTTFGCTFGQPALLPSEVVDSAHRVDYSPDAEPLDLSSFQRLKTLIVLTKIRDLGDWGGYYTSPIPWIGATIRLIPPESSVSNIIIDMETEGFAKGRILNVDFFPFPRSIVAGYAQDNEARNGGASRLKNLRALAIHFRHNGVPSVWDERYIPGLKRGPLRELSPLGILNLTHGVGWH